jgi:hypothetical protein
VLVVQVSEHARSVVREADVARRIMYAARSENAAEGFRPPSSRGTRSGRSHTPADYRGDRASGRDPSFA